MSATALPESIKAVISFWIFRSAVYGECNLNSLDMKLSLEINL